MDIDIFTEVCLAEKKPLLIQTPFGLISQVKQPGLDMSTVQSELDLSYRQRYQGVTIPEAYERLILDTYGPLGIYSCFQLDLVRNWLRLHCTRTIAAVPLSLLYLNTEKLITGSDFAE